MKDIFSLKLYTRVARLGRGLAEKRTAARHQPLYNLGHRTRSRYRQAEVLSSGAATRCMGLRLGGRRVPDDRPRRPQTRRASEQGWIRFRIRSRQCEGAERVADRKEYKLREGYRPEAPRTNRPP